MVNTLEPTTGRKEEIGFDRLTRMGTRKTHTGSYLFLLIHREEHWSDLWNLLFHTRDRNDVM